MTGVVIPVREVPIVCTGTGLAPASADAHRLECRLHRIEGQIRGIQHMVESGRDCVDVLTQIAAVRGALDSLAMQLVEQQIRRCILDATGTKSPACDAAVADITTAISRLTRRP